MACGGVPSDAQISSSAKSGPKAPQRSQRDPKGRPKLAQRTPKAPPKGTVGGWVGVGGVGYLGYGGGWGHQFGIKRIVKTEKDINLESIGW